MDVEGRAAPLTPATTLVDEHDEVEVDAMVEVEVDL